MAKISSRPTEINENIERLRELITDLSGGIVGNSSAMIDAGTDLTGLIDHIETYTDTAMLTIEMAEAKALSYALDNIALSVQLAEAVAYLNRLTDIKYDDALDHSTADLMDAMMSSGMADSTDDGELMFNGAAIISKEDLKPMLREALIRWVSLKLS